MPASLSLQSYGDSGKDESSFYAVPKAGARIRTTSWARLKRVSKSLEPGPLDTGRSCRPPVEAFSR